MGVYTGRGAQGMWYSKGHILSETCREIVSYVCPTSGAPITALCNVPHPTKRRSQLWIASPENINVSLFKHMNAPYRITQTNPKTKQYQSSKYRWRLEELDTPTYGIQVTRAVNRVESSWRMLLARISVLASAEGLSEVDINPFTAEGRAVIHRYSGPDRFTRSYYGHILAHYEPDLNRQYIQYNGPEQFYLYGRHDKAPKELLDIVFPQQKSADFYSQLIKIEV